MKFSSAYDNHAASLAGFDCSEPTCGSLTRSEFVQDCDINAIMARYVRTGILDHATSLIPAFADVSALGDYATLKGKLEIASNAFLELPAKLRDMVGNDPANFLSFVADPENSSVLAEYGLIDKVLDVGDDIPPTKAEETE